MLFVNPNVGNATTGSSFQSSGIDPSSNSTEGASDIDHDDFISDKYEDDLVVAGWFTLTDNNQTINNIARWNGSYWLPLGSDNGIPVSNQSDKMQHK